MSQNASIRTFVRNDLETILPIWDKTIRKYSFLAPLTPQKVAMVFLDKQGFMPEGFYLLEDAAGIRGGMAVSAPPAAEEARLLLWFTRSGRPDDDLQQILDHTLAWLKARGIKKLVTDRHAKPDAPNLPVLQFFLNNRFYVATGQCRILNQNTALAGVLLGRKIGRFNVPRAVQRKQAELEAKGYSFFWLRDAPPGDLVFTKDIPFADVWPKVVNARSDREHLLCARFQGEIVGCAMVSQPYAPTDWPHHGCDDGLFGPTGVSPAHRGGLGSGLLFRTVEKLRALGFRDCLIPTSTSTFQFYYKKAGFNIVRLRLTMARDLAGEVRIS